LPNQTFAGTRFRRRPDPAVVPVSPQGLTPNSAFSANLVYYDYEAGNYVDLIVPELESIIPYVLLLFGTDYPAIVNFTTHYTQFTYSQGGVVNPVDNYSFRENDAGPLISGGSGMVGLAYDILIPTTITPYQKIIVGTTVTNNISNISGYSYIVTQKEHNLRAETSNPTGGSLYTTYSAYVPSVDVICNGAIINGPGLYVPTLGVDSLHMNVILHESLFTQAVIDAGYTISGVGLYYGYSVPTIFTVVGLWASESFIPPTPPAIEVGRMAAPASVSTSSAIIAEHRERILAKFAAKFPAKLPAKP
jgi:hypothetical protein